MLFIAQGSVKFQQLTATCQNGDFLSLPLLPKVSAKVLYEEEGRI